MLGEGKRAQCSVEGSASRGNERLLQEKLEVHFPDPGHLVEQDQGFLEQGVDLAVFGGVDRRIQLVDVFCSEDQVLLRLATCLSSWEAVPPTIFQSL